MPKTYHSNCDHPATSAARETCRKAGGPGVGAVQALDHANCDHPPTNTARKRCRRKVSPHLKAKRAVKYVGVGERAPADLAIIPTDGLSTTSFLHLPLASANELLISFFAPKHQSDEAVWAEEGPVELEDISDPRVRDKVRRVAAEQEARLELRLLAGGLHITQHRPHQATTAPAGPLPG